MLYFVELTWGNLDRLQGELGASKDILDIPWRDILESPLSGGSEVVLEGGD